MNLVTPLVLEDAHDVVEVDPDGGDRSHLLAGRALPAGTIGRVDPAVVGEPPSSRPAWC